MTPMPLSWPLLRGQTLALACMPPTRDFAGVFAEDFAADTRAAANWRSDPCVGGCATAEDPCSACRL